MERISLERNDSRTQLLEQLKRNRCSVLLGANDEAIKEFHLALLSNGAIGVCSQGAGIEPSIFVDEVNEEAWVGYNSKIANVDLNSYRTKFELALDWVFYSIVCQMQDSSVIVVHELGACRVDRAGHLIWNRTTDVVTGFSDEGATLRLSTEEQEIRIDKVTGETL